MGPGSLAREPRRPGQGHRRQGLFPVGGENGQGAPPLSATPIPLSRAELEGPAPPVTPVQTPKGQPGSWGHTGAKARSAKVFPWFEGPGSPQHPLCSLTIPSQDWGLGDFTPLGNTGMPTAVTQLPLKAPRPFGKYD